MTKYQINPNLTFLTECWSDKSIHGVCLEGSSRSGKSYSIIDFLIALSTIQKGLIINIVRETYNSFKTTLYLDFARRLSDFGITPNPFGYVQDISTYNLLGNKINFMGTDKPDRLEGAGSDIFWINEMLDVNKVAFDQLEQRCRRFWMADWNPKTTAHWCFDLELRPDVRFLRTTLFDNPFISDNEKQKLLGFEPTPENIARGTADEYRWKVYGLGQRAARQGLVHPNVTWIDKFPDDTDVDKIGYGVDFGFTNSPTAIVKVGKRENDLYVKLLFYAPTPTINDVFTAIGATIPKDCHFTCDSAEPGIISDLRRNGYNAIPAKKFAGSVKYGIDLINRHRLFYVRDVNLRKEQENRVWKYVGGIPLNEPEAGNDHAHDALAYCLQTDFR